MQNNDYILRSDAIKALYQGYEKLGLTMYRVSCIEKINKIPAAKVEPKRYAEWINPIEIFVCSSCSKAAPYDVEGDIIMYWPDLNFCPYCGCRMNKKPEEKKDD